MNRKVPQHPTTDGPGEPLGRDDQELVLRAMNGDSAAFDALVARHRRVVLGIARRLTSNIDDAEDVAQETFLRAFMRLSTFRFKSSFRTWLVAIAVNQARMWNRHTRRSRETFVLHADSESSPPQSFEPADRHANPEEQCTERQWMHLLREEISRLAPITRAAICSCDLKELSVIDTAVLLGVTVSAIKSRRSRARNALREKLADRLRPRSR